MLVPCGKHMIHWEEIIAIVWYEHKLNNIPVTLAAGYTIYLPENVLVYVSEEDVTAMLKSVVEMQKAQRLANSQ